MGNIFLLLGIFYELLFANILIIKHLANIYFR